MEQPYFIEKSIQNLISKQRKKYKGLEEEFEKGLKDKIPDAINKITKAVAEEIYKYCLDDNNDLKKREKKINKKINKKYQLAIKFFEGFIELNAHISSITYRKYFKVFENLEDHVKLDTLIALHVRACQVANEIRILIVNGYADGAHARWRTLHELCVTFLFLYDSTYEVIQMYNDYEVIERYKKMKEYSECYQKLDFDKIEDHEMEDITLARERILKKYGKEFSDSYGWTMASLPKGKRNFRELEKLVEKDYLRVIYCWANESVHSGVSGIKTKLSLRDNQQKYFLTGPNDCGFTDPAQFTTCSLLEMSLVLLEMEDSLLNKVYTELLYFFQNEVVKNFLTSEKNN